MCFGAHVVCVLVIVCVVMSVVAPDVRQPKHNQDPSDFIQMDNHLAIVDDDGVCGDRGCCVNRGCVKTCQEVMAPKVIDVLVIGNGPSGMAISNVLRGVHPSFDVNSAQLSTMGHTGLYRRVLDAIRARTKGKQENVSLLDLSLRDLSVGLEGRSNNPIALLADHLLMPGADSRPTLSHMTTTRREHIPHVLVGHGEMGGSWNDMGADILTLSPSSWMSLPGYSLTSYLRDQGKGEWKAAAIGRERLERSVIADYYRAYAHKFQLYDNFRRGKVVYIRPFTPLSECDEDSAGGWEVGIRVDNEDPRSTEENTSGEVGMAPTLTAETGATPAGASSSSEATSTATATASPEAATPEVEVRGTRTQALEVIRCNSVVMAGGMYSVTQHLGIEGEDLPFVHHRIPPQAVLAATTSTTAERRRVMLVVGGGLSAGDCIHHAHRHGWRVIHVFRTDAHDTKIHKMFSERSDRYMEYHGISRMMTGEQTFELYERFESAELISIGEDKTCLVQERGPDRKLSGGHVHRVSADMVVVLVGSTPDLSLLKYTCDVTKSIAVPVANPTKATDKDSTHPVYIDVDPYTMRVTADWLAQHLEWSDGDGGICEGGGGSEGGDGGGGVYGCSSHKVGPEARRCDGGDQEHQRLRDHLERYPIYATGPLRGDNFVRFVVGDAWAIGKDLASVRL